MCEFVSWIRKGNKLFYFTNDEMDTKEGKLLMRENPGFKKDAVGHGTIRKYFDIYSGIEQELTEAAPSKYPKEIVQAIKKYKFSRVPGAYNVSFLTQDVRDEWYSSLKRITYRDDDGSIRIQYVMAATRHFWELFRIKKNRIPAWR